MKKFIIILTVLPLLLITPVVAAENSEKDKDTKIVTVPAGEVVDKDFFGFGDIVEISGTVNGDVYAFGGQVLVDGIVNGDLISAGGTVSISGTVTQDVRVGGGQVTISGDIGRNVSVGGGNVEFTDSATVEGSILAGGGNISIASPVGSNVKVGAGNLTISNKVDGDVEAGVENLRLTSKSAVTGDLTYWSEEEASIDDNAVISGEVTKKTGKISPKPSFGHAFGGFAAFNIVTAIIGFVSTFILGFLIIKLLPLVTKTNYDTLNKKPLASFGVGILGLILTPILFTILMVTVLALPLGFMLLALYFIALYVSRVFVINWIGLKIMEQTGRKVNVVWSFLLGLVIYYILTLIPVVGGIVTLLTVVFGIGAALITKKEIYKLARKKDII